MRNGFESGGYYVCRDKENGGDREENPFVPDDAQVDWKQTIEKNFKIWLEELSSSNDPIAPEERDGPDLYSFYEDLSALRAEFRKSARRSHDTFSKLGETLSQFEHVVKELAAKGTETESAREKEDLFSKKRLILPLAEILDRFTRMGKRLESPPKAGFFTAGRKWLEAWASLREAFTILHSHFDELLKKEGVTAMETAGKPFDPSFMKAVEVEETSRVSPNTVLEEFTCGYLYGGHVLKLAEVKVSKEKGA